MDMTPPIWSDPVEYLRRNQPEDPVIFLSAPALQAQAQRFLSGFPGLVTYAVKANPDPAVIAGLVAAGLGAFDVASPEEIALIRRLAPRAALHYNNPVRARAEIAFAVAQGVRSFAVDSASELEKLIALVPPGAELSVRFKQPVGGAAYDFGAKFGATEDRAASLLRRVVEAGFVPSLTFHPGTQCSEPQAWDSYIHAAGRIARAAGLRPRRLNTGGGFPSRRTRAEAPPLEAIFDRIGSSTAAAFGAEAPALVCEPGRALVADAMALAARVKAVRDDGAVFLNDGVYGSFMDLPLMGAMDRLSVVSPEGTPRRAPVRPRVVFGPTCDSIDRLPGEAPLPGDIAEGDYLILQGMGAYSAATNTRFNGFGALARQRVRSLDA